MIQEEEEEEEDDENMDKMCKSFFPILCTYYITTQPIFVYWLFFTIESEMNKILIYGFNGDRP